MKIYIDPRNSCSKSYHTAGYYLEKGCKKVAKYRDYIPYENSNGCEIISVGGNYVFVDDPTQADCVLILSEPNEKVEYLLKDEQIYDICQKSEAPKKIVLDEQDITNKHPLIYMFGSAVEEVEITENVLNISDWPNAFCNCQKIQNFIVNVKNKRYIAECYKPISDFDPRANVLIDYKARLENGETVRALHTFPPVLKNVSQYDRLTLAVDKIYNEAFIAPIKADFLTLNGLREWVVPGPEVLGQRVIFICENMGIVNFLSRRRIKAILENDLLQYTQLRGSYNGKKEIVEEIDRTFKNSFGYVDGCYR